MSKNTPATYASAGVNLELYDQAMEKLPDVMRRTHSSRVIDLPGGFAGLFRLMNGQIRYDDPVLVSGTDGVGTKIKVASAAQKFDTIGIDLVAMCVNDCLCIGAEPLFFLDYLALGKDDPVLVPQLVSGVAAGCQLAQSALLGGETAIMPGLYQPGDFDLAGFSVGVVERTQMITGEAIRPGDVVLGLPSSGLHSNGFSLVRKAVFDIAGLEIDQTISEFDQTVGEILLTPTQIYVDAITSIRQAKNLWPAVHGIAHITGGGLAGNLERIIPQTARAVIRRGSWTVPSVFPWVQQCGNIEETEMEHVFNLGVGMVLVVAADQADAIREVLTDGEKTPYVIGEIVAGDGGVELV
ncbi:MAG: phosphoribosylformylglycinamidine cyclo-ligase [Planctomycetota bacterium]|nr:phosphoribosylformylglycinamidine cyclo-ligase [Planctomycetota bacterium]MDA1214314.1 phosphoribosylformylglycinamidine cyclo-ligase [Planctomycetota bacterium]